MQLHRPRSPFLKMYIKRNHLSHTRVTHIWRFLLWLSDGLYFKGVVEVCSKSLGIAVCVVSYSFYFLNWAFSVCLLCVRYSVSLFVIRTMKCQKIKLCHNSQTLSFFSLPSPVSLHRNLHFHFGFIVSFYTDWNFKMSPVLFKFRNKSHHLLYFTLKSPTQVELYKSGITDIVFHRLQAEPMYASYIHRLLHTIHFGTGTVTPRKVCNFMWSATSWLTCCGSTLQ